MKTLADYKEKAVFFRNIIENLKEDVKIKPYLTESLEDMEDGLQETEEVILITEMSLNFERVSDD